MIFKSQLKFGKPGEHIKLEFRTYANGRTAIEAVDQETDEPIAALTVNFDEAEIPVEEGITFIKNYSENEGAMRTLFDAGIIEPTGRVVLSGYVQITEVRVLKTA